jgi:hypothetical protein
VSGRWKAKDPDALEVVHDLFGQIMMRHSKAQTSGQAGRALVHMPPKYEEDVLVPLQDSSERFVYNALERREHRRHRPTRLVDASACQCCVPLRARAIHAASWTEVASALTDSFTVT